MRASVASFLMGPQTGREEGEKVIKETGREEREKRMEGQLVLEGHEKRHTKEVGDYCQDQTGIDGQGAAGEGNQAEGASSDSESEMSFGEISDHGSMDGDEEVDEGVDFDGIREDEDMKMEIEMEMEIGMEGGFRVK